MNTTIMLAKRNTKIFLRDKVSVFFSFLSIIIIFLLYAMFLGDMQVKQFKIESVNITDIKYFINSWIIAGIIAVTIITSSLAAFAIVVKDKQNNTINDFMSSPIKRSLVKKK